MGFYGRFPLFSSMERFPLFARLMHLLRQGRRRKSSGTKHIERRFRNVLLNVGNRTDGRDRATYV